MKKTLVLTAIAMLAMPIFSTYAEQAHHPDKQEMAMGGQQDVGPMMEKMRAHMNKMMQQMEQIRATDDPDTRDKLMVEHMQSMHEGMGMMHGMGGPMMMGKGSMGNGMMMNKGDMGKDMNMDDDIMMRMNRMENRMDMMQEMMGQIVESDRQAEETREIRKRHDHRKTK